MTPRSSLRASALLFCVLLAAVSATATPRLAREDEAFLEDLSRRAFRYFQEQADPRTGLVLDRARTDGGPVNGVASIAATGFGLTGWCIAAERGWVAEAEAAARVRATLSFLANELPHEHGWFHHFVDPRTGARVWQCELSSIDTALLLAGVLTARQTFRRDADIRRLATAIYERVDFPWMLAGHPTLLSMGWRPETGFLPARWDHYSELMILYLLGLGSPTRPLPSASWAAWRREEVRYGAFRFIGAADPLFVHQYSHAWIDFRGRRERRAPHADYFENSVRATRAHRQFCLDLAKEFPGYTDAIWGITASDSARGYVAWGGPPRHGPIDGTVVPCAAAGSLMFAPEIALPALRAMKDRFGDRIYGRYGFADAFHPTNGWVNPDVIGIDLGITLLSAENLRRETVWRRFMRNPEIPRALRLAGLTRVRKS